MAHLDGTSFRKLADPYELGSSTLYQKCFDNAFKLPHCADITRMYCSKLQGTLVVDGKFVKVKGYDSKIPFLYGIDYSTHDIPTFKMATNESYLSWLKYFQSLRLLNYPLKMVVADDNENIRAALFEVYPKAFFQLCTNHFKENIRKTLMVRSDPTYRGFMSKIATLFHMKRSKDDFNRIEKNILHEYKNDQLCVKVLIDINNKKDILMGHANLRGTPTTNNIIESFNSHFQARFKATKGYESFHHAAVWINALILRRRFKKFTDCKGKFKNLNGKSSISKTQKHDVDLPTFLEILGANF